MLRRTAAIAVLCAAALAPAASADAGWQRWSSTAASGMTAAPAPSAREALHRVKAAFATRHARGKEAARGKPTDLTPLMWRLAAELPSLHGSERRQAVRLLARPTDGAADPDQNGYSVPEAPNSPMCSAHYCIHWVASGPDAPDLTDANGNGIPDWIETVDATAENVYAVENGQLAWRPPKGDGTRGGGFNLTDIYLKDIGGSGVYGYTAPDSGQHNTTTDHSQFAYTIVDNDFAKSQFPQYTTPVTPLDVTIAHEYNHVLQFNYDSLEDTWMFEATAVWMEGKVYDAAHDYLQYLPGWAQLTTLPMTAFDGLNANDRNNVKVYGSSVWNKWLDARYGQEVVRGAWEDSLSVSPRSFAPAAYDASIRQHGGPGFSTEFATFAGATAEWQAQNSGFPEGALYPDVVRAGRLAVDGSPGKINLNHTGFAMADVPVPGVPRIKLAMGAPAGTSAALVLVGRVGGSTGGTMTEFVRTLPKGGGGTIVLDNPGNFSRLTAVLINTDIQQSGFSQQTGDWIFKKDGQPFFADVSTDFSAPRVKGVSPRSGSGHVGGRQKIVVTFSEPVTGVTGKTFELVGRGGHVVRAKLQFKDGTRTATLVPRGGLHRGERYRVVVSRSITDLALNRLSRPPSWTFTGG